MKGFPNQVADLSKLEMAMKVISDLLAAGENPRNDTILGEALLRATIIRPRNKKIPKDEYLVEQKKKGRSYRSFEAAARLLRELFKILGLLDDDGEEIRVTPIGAQIASLTFSGISRNSLDLWRRVIRLMLHDGGDGQTSHPYQVLLRLISRKPGITRAKCALALEAKNDSDAELDRIVKLSELSEENIRKRIGARKSNWENAKKILPHFAEQLKDVTKVGQKLYLSYAPGTAQAPIESGGSTPGKTRIARAPRGASSVDSNTIATAGTLDVFDEAADSDEAGLDPQTLRQRRERLRDRLRRHNLLVQEIARLLESENAHLYENPFDCLACYISEALLIEAKSLDGTPDDEKLRVREALAQLLYYESFVMQPLIGERAVQKVACFERKVSDEHIRWLESIDIRVIWKCVSGISATPESAGNLVGHFGF
jgi:hypothetical protein